MKVINRPTHVYAGRSAPAVFRQFVKAATFGAHLYVLIFKMLFEYR